MFYNADTTWTYWNRHQAVYSWTIVLFDQSMSFTFEGFQNLKDDKRIPLFRSIFDGITKTKRPSGKTRQERKKLRNGSTLAIRHKVVKPGFVDCKRDQQPKFSPQLDSHTMRDLNTYLQSWLVLEGTFRNYHQSSTQLIEYFRCQFFSPYIVMRKMNWWLKYFLDLALLAPIHCPLSSWFVVMSTWIDLCQKWILLLVQSRPSWTSGVKYLSVHTLLIVETLAKTMTILKSPRIVTFLSC